MSSNGRDLDQRYFFVIACFKTINFVCLEGEEQSKVDSNPKKVDANLEIGQDDQNSEIMKQKEVEIKIKKEDAEKDEDELFDTQEEIDDK